MSNTGILYKVANIIEEGKLGGPQVRIAEVAGALKNRVETVIVMPKENSKEFQQRCDLMGVRYHTLPISRITKEWRVALKYIIFSPIEVLWLVLVLKKEKVDVVHVSGGSWQYKGVIAGKLARKKVLWHLNDTCMPLFIRRVFACINPLSDGFIFASERSKSYYQPLTKMDKPEFVIPAPVDTVKFNPEIRFKGDESLVSKWSGKMVVGVVANVNPIKGLDVFIKAAAAVNKRVRNVQFVVIGPIYENQERHFGDLKLLCEKLDVFNIEFLGGRSDVRPLLRRLDIYVCSSVAESSPISVWEAMAMGKPVVSTDVGDVPLYVRDNYNGFIVDIGDSKTLSGHLNVLLSNPELRVELGSRCRDTALRKLGLNRCAALHLEAYKDVIGRSR